MKTRADLAVLIDFVGQGSAVFHDKESGALKELGDAREQTHAAHALPLRLFEQCLQRALAAATTLPLQLHHDGAHLSQMWAVEMQRTATLKLTAIGFGDGE